MRERACLLWFFLPLLPRIRAIGIIVFVFHKRPLNGTARNTNFEVP
jgi:hypothetical protein